MIFVVLFLLRCTPKFIRLDGENPVVEVEWELRWDPAEPGEIKSYCGVSLAKIRNCWILFAQNNPK